MAKSKKEIEAVKQDILFTAMSYREIGKIHGLAPATLTKWCKKYGWVRSKQDGNKQVKKVNKPKVKKRPGTNRAELDYKQLDKLCEILCTGEECAAILGVDYDTLNSNLKYDGYIGFSEYFKKASANGKMSLRRKQFKVAIDGNVTMLIWLGKQHLGQTDKAERYATDKEDEREHYTEFR